MPGRVIPETERSTASAVPWGSWQDKDPDPDRRIEVELDR